MTSTTASVVVITFERPDYVVRCLNHLMAQTTTPHEVIVIDSSVSDDTERRVTKEFPSVTYRKTSAGRGAMATARNIGFEIASGDVVAFVDDDAFAERNWLARLLAPYDDPDVGAVGGRQIRGQPDELTDGVDDIGRFCADGTLTGHFTADPGHLVLVDHLLGANMSFRRSVLCEIGGIRDGYFGTCVREETDLCLRVTAAGYRIVYTPDAVVDHLAAPYAKGRRFDLRYAYWAQKNHVILLVRSFGPTKPVLRAFVVATGRHIVQDLTERARLARSRLQDHDPAGASRSLSNGGVRAVVETAGTMTGFVAGMRMARLDRRGIAITQR